MFEILITEGDIQSRVKVLAQEISQYYGTRPVVLVPVLYGALPFYQDLCRHLPPEWLSGFIRIKSRNGEQIGAANVYTYEGPALQGQEVLFIEDVVDTGATLVTLRQWASEQGIANMEMVSATLKPEARKRDLLPRWVGFQTPEVFLLGYGMDLDHQFRNLPHIGFFPGKD